MLDLLLIHLEKGGNPEIVIQSEKKRFRDVEKVNKCVEMYTEWRKKRNQCDTLRMEYGKINKQIAERKKASKGQDKCEVYKNLLFII
jgi:seryl-tRNA synthetase